MAAKEWASLLAGLALAGAGWLRFSPDFGQDLPAGTTVDVAVTFDPAGLEVGTYTAEIRVFHNDRDTAQNPVLLPATLNVLPHVLALTPEAAFWKEK